MIRLTEEQKAEFIDSGWFDGNLFTHQIIDCLERASDDKDFWLGWEKARDKHMQSLPSYAWLDPDESTYNPDVMMYKQAIMFFGSAFESLAIFGALPKWSGRQTKSFIQRMESEIDALRESIGAIPPEQFELWSALDSTRISSFLNVLTELKEFCERSSTLPVLGKPNTPRLDRHFVTAQTLSLAQGFGYPSYGTIASMMNAMFPNYETVDASYVQSVARRLK